MNKHILIVEDEEKIARVIQLELEHEGYSVEKVKTGERALEEFQNGGWDLILLDVMIPQLNGMEVLRRIRAKDKRLPVILVTARDSVIDKVSGLDQGANDYITKPFVIEELLARIRACLRTLHTNQEEDEILKVSDLTLNPSTREVLRGDQSVELTPREFDLLLFLIRHHRQVLNREQILQHVWGYAYYGDTNVVDVYIRYLRKKVDAGFDAPLIHTVRGIGYVLKE
ncbi:response regulator transcription factor [Sporolactobacillus sp. Y61]|uniref:Response regulator transcription factor n=1 Tax=Sporolactobacillus sp. Y61 TaxID=3160863 RepID=A0AAU8IFJ6_9BACL|nr:response regulator transcription factor [Sporolactobacillus sp. THM19-2]RYL92454.1 response regulator transcription factor [Sporolactobacillus sp. THM19-2]